jgi:hypothetical protein
MGSIFPDELDMVRMSPLMWIQGDKRDQWWPLAEWQTQAYEEWEQWRQNQEGEEDHSHDPYRVDSTLSFAPKRFDPRHRQYEYTFRTLRFGSKSIYESELFLVNVTTGMHRMLWVVVPTAPRHTGPNTSDRTAYNGMTSIASGYGGTTKRLINVPEKPATAPPTNPKASLFNRLDASTFPRRNKK